jgi:hypothetical protein
MHEYSQQPHSQLKLLLDSLIKAEDT